MWAPGVLSISNKLGNVQCVGAYFNSEICSVWCHGLMNNTHPTRHTSEFFEKWQNRRCLFTRDLRLFKSNTARDEVISANSQTQHRRTADTWLAVRHLTLFFFIGLKNLVNLVFHYYIIYATLWAWFKCYPSTMPTC